MNRDVTQSTLFTEDINDALKDAVRALGEMKEVGRKLRPELTSDAAGAWLKDCLNPLRRERLDPEQVVWLIREARAIGCHSIMNYLADEGGYTRPAPLSPQDEAAELQREFIQAVGHVESLTRRLERINLLKSVA